ncbi:Molybdenum transport system permease protein ModB [Desulfosporosinus sp. I2]|uniref:molybdate ABC transporter permease subunit n=1 Tax=Desulfosporosinus sp. I2 TaxID=1617025 RepID=UPI00061EB02E|nr:molybdate ABC transporter permease subunit [Desulfosporosinus sp. I2]KJR45389.1 Molybdenum transport system permease protein ModB [Desulfosporosinus sp. I2]
MKVVAKMMMPDLIPLYLSLRLALTATLIGLLIGLPIAWFLGQTKWKGREILDSLISIPMVLPPTVLGYYLLVLLGRNSWIGKLAERLAIPLVFTTRGAIIAATVVSIPFFIKTARSAIEGVPFNLMDAARVLGRTDLNIFFSVVIPNAWKGIAAGLVLMFARALGDFGTTLMVSGGYLEKR